MKVLREEEQNLKGMILGDIPDHFLSEEDKAYKANVLRCKEIQRAAQAAQQRENLNAMYKAFGWV